MTCVYPPDTAVGVAKGPMTLAYSSTKPAGPVNSVNTTTLSYTSENFLGALLGPYGAPVKPHSSSASDMDSSESEFDPFRLWEKRVDEFC